MCESTAYLETQEGLKKIMDNVIFIIPENDKIYLEDILGDQLTMDGKIKEIKLLDHKIIIENI